MKIKIFKDLTKFTLTSALTKSDIEMVKKYRPEALKIKDADKNDLFAVSYCEGHPCISPTGVTFGSKSTDGDFAMIVGDLPEKIPSDQSAGDYIADKVGAALAYINAMESTIPSIVTDIKSERAALIGSIVEA